ncbi:cell adhesion molecule DSCAML1-like [Lineus longissimus]|uniref:cell adhesion molecule DSCAML1-like n=1 Tax=Lineus longissimus TaxID=88925 RepID=UPI00315D389A
MSYRSTPVRSTGYSPSRLMMGREIATTIPTLRRNLRPQWPDAKRVSENMKSMQLQYKQQYDSRHGVASLPVLTTGEKVRVKLDGQKKWSEPATVVQHHATPRSYIIRSSEGKDYRRNRRHLQRIPSNVHTGEPPSVSSSTANVVRPQSSRNRTRPMSPARNLAGTPAPSSSEPPASPSQPVTPPMVESRTRSGRDIKPPVWSKDYVAK